MIYLILFLLLCLALWIYDKIRTHFYIKKMCSLATEYDAFRFNHITCSLNYSDQEKQTKDMFDFFDEVEQWDKGRNH